MNYFDEWWIKQNPGWYHGFVTDEEERIPTNNNALESTKRLIKSHSTFRSQMPIEDFCHCAMHDIIKNWSLDYSPGAEEQPNVNYKEFQLVPPIALKDYDASFAWREKDKSLL